jgi:hypothetical protein
MADELDRLAANLMRDAADTVDKVRTLATCEGWSLEDTLMRLAATFREIAAAMDAA